ncbi:MAG TPA: acyl carrier protein [Gaiellaceae bacterium]|nr:acyl carrier protein [Gaiellaceae bacterium]
MKRDEIMTRLENVFEQVLGRRVDLRDETTAADVDGWDSIAHVLLVLASEKEFDVRFESSEIANAANVGEFVDLVEVKTA